MTQMLDNLVEVDLDQWEEQVAEEAALQEVLVAAPPCLLFEVPPTRNIL
jgi:hypothetical protein